MTYAHGLAALADPTRRAVYERVRLRPHTVGELARLVQVTQPAVSQHLRILRQARLVTGRREGTRCYYSASREGLEQLRHYVESLWRDALTAFEAPDRGRNL